MQFDLDPNSCAAVVEPVDTMVSKTIGLTPCGFKSRRPHHADVAQLVEHLPSKQDVASSNLVVHSNSLFSAPRVGLLAVGIIPKTSEKKCLNRLFGAGHRANISVNALVAEW